MACDTAFRIVARGCLLDLTANQEAAHKGNAEALHQMRVALTRLRTATAFFLPMVADSQLTQLRRELQWLHAHLGSVRDLDVAIERLREVDKRAPATRNFQTWQRKRTESHQHLARALRSIRYRRLVRSLAGWIDSGAWSTKTGKQATHRRSRPIATFSARKLTRWQEKLLKKSHKLRVMSAKRRHRLRLMNKKLCYSIEFLSDLYSDKRSCAQLTALTHLRKAQQSLGQLNDDANGQALAIALERDGVRLSMPLLSRRRKKRLVRTAVRAYRKLAALKAE